MKKRIFSIALLFVMTVSLLCGCGKEKLYGDRTKQDLEVEALAIVQTLADCAPDELESGAQYYEANGLDMYADLFRGWGEISSTQGALTGYKDYNIDQTGKTYTAKMELQFEKRDAILTIVYKTYNMEMESITIEPVYTLQETMAKAGLNTVMGIGIVFVILILISLIIKSFEFINKAQKKAEEKAAAKTAEPAVIPGPIKVPEVSADEELVAVIAAAIAASTGRTTDDFVVRSIRRR